MLLRLTVYGDAVARLAFNTPFEMPGVLVFGFCGFLNVSVVVFMFLLRCVLRGFCGGFCLCRVGVVVVVVVLVEVGFGVGVWRGFARRFINWMSALRI